MTDHNGGLPLTNMLRAMCLRPFDNFVHDVKGTPFDLVEDAAHILADHAKKNQLQSAQEQQYRDQRSPPALRIVVYEVIDQGKHAIHDAECRYDCADREADRKWELGKGDDAAQGKAEAAAEIILRRPPNPCRAGKRQIGGFESDPA